MIRLFFFLLCLLAPLPASAKPDASEKLRQVQSELDRQQQQAQALDQKAKETAGDVQNLRSKLIAATADLQKRETEAGALEDHLDDLESEIKDKADELAKNKARLRELTGILLRISREPPASYFLRTVMTDDHIHRAILLRSVLPRLRDEAEEAARDLEALDALRARTAEQKRLVEAARQNLEWQRHGLDQLVRTRQGLLNRTEAQKQAIARQLVSLTDEAKDLQQLLEKVAPAHRHAPPSGLNPALKWPVAGPVVKGFGVRDADGVLSQGLTLAGPSGGPVIAPLAGKVVFAGPFRGYGQILILQHKGGYHSFLAGFGRVDAEMGQEVEAGEPLGILPARETGRPELYFEWRRNGEPADPMEGISRSKSKDAP